MKTRNKTIIAGSAALAIGAIAVGFKLQASEPATETAASGSTAHTIILYIRAQAAPVVQAGQNILNATVLM